MGCYIWYIEEEGPGRAAAPPSPLLAVPNVTAHPSTASVPITVLLYGGPLLCSFNVAIKGLKRQVIGGDLGLSVCSHNDDTETTECVCFSFKFSSMLFRWSLLVHSTVYEVKEPT